MIGKFKGVVSCCIVSFLVLAQLGPRPASAQSSTAGGALWEEVQKLIYELVKRQAVRDLGKNIRDKSPEICYYFGDAISRMSSRNWGGVQGALKEGAITAMGDFIYWRMTTEKSFASFSENLRGFRQTFVGLKISTKKNGEIDKAQKIIQKSRERLSHTKRVQEKADIDLSNAERGCLYQAKSTRQEAINACQKAEAENKENEYRLAKIKGKLSSTQWEYHTATGTPHHLCSRRWWVSLPDVKVGQVQQYCEKKTETGANVKTACGVARLAMAYLRNPEKPLPTRALFTKAIANFVTPILKNSLNVEFGSKLIEELVKDPKSFKKEFADLQQLTSTSLEKSLKECGILDKTLSVPCIAVQYYSEAKSKYNSFVSGQVELKIGDVDTDISLDELLGKSNRKFTSTWYAEESARVERTRISEYNETAKSMGSKYTIDEGALRKIIGEGSGEALNKATDLLNGQSRDLEFVADFEEVERAYIATKKVAWGTLFRDAKYLCHGKKAIKILSVDAQTAVFLSQKGRICVTISPLLRHLRTNWDKIETLRRETEQLVGKLRTIGIPVNFNVDSLLKGLGTLDQVRKLAEKIESRIETFPKGATDFDYLFAVVDACLSFTLHDAGPALADKILEGALRNVLKADSSNKSKMSVSAVLHVFSLVSENAGADDTRLEGIVAKLQNLQNLQNLKTVLEVLKMSGRKEVDKKIAKVAGEALNILKESDRTMLNYLPSKRAVEDWTESSKERAVREYSKHIAVILGMEIGDLQIIVRYANDRTLRSLMRFVRQGDVREIALLLLESSLLSSGNDGSLNRLVVNFASYVLDQNGKESSKDIARDAFRAAALEWLENVSDDEWKGFPLTVSEDGKTNRWGGPHGSDEYRYLWWFSRPTFGLRYLRNRLNPEVPSYNPSVTISTARVFQYALSDRIGVQGTLLDLDMAGRGLANHKNVIGKDRYLLAADIFRPRLDLWFGLPTLSRRLVLLAGVSTSVFAMTDVKVEENEDKKIKMDFGFTLSNVHFDFGLGYFF